MSGPSSRSVEKNLARVRERLAEAAVRSGRTHEAVTLVAVTKTFPAEVVVAAANLGVSHFGENRVEEGAAKIAAVEAAFSGQRLAWHMVGHVQSRKAREVAGAFDFVQSVDSLRVARRLGRFAGEAGRRLSILLECNVSGEASKYGFEADRWRTDDVQRATLFSAVEEALSVPGVSVEGLMTMAPVAKDPEDARPVFVGLRALYHELQLCFPEAGWRHLSMGMTDDFEVAVEEGATMVRIGRAIFGTRPH